MYSSMNCITVQQKVARGAGKQRQKIVRTIIAEINKEDVVLGCSSMGKVYINLRKYVCCSTSSQLKCTESGLEKKDFAIFAQ